MRPELIKTSNPGIQTSIDFEKVEKLEAKKQEYINKYKIISQYQKKLYLVKEEWYYDDLPVDKYFEKVDYLYSKTPAEKRYRHMDGN